MYIHDKNSDERIKYTTYLSGVIESANKDEMSNFRKELTEKLSCKDLLIYDPVAQEASKVGKLSGEHVEYIKGLKRAGRWSIFYEELWKIYFGSITINTDLVQLLTHLRMKKHIEGNRPRDLKFWGDAEATIRSDFIIVHYPTGTKTIGTIFEFVWAFMWKIPVYLILPSSNNTEENSSLLFADMVANNGILKSYYSINDCVKAIKEDYKI